MQKRNFILLIIVLVIVFMSLFGYLYLTRNTDPNNTSTGTNFISRFNPFGVQNTNPPSTTPIPENPGGDDTPETPAEVSKLTKVSSMPIAGYGVFTKERLKNLPVVVVTPAAPETALGAESAAPAAATPVSKPKTTTKPTPPPTEFATAVRYVNRATGNIYQTFADKIEERKFSKTIIPKVYDAYFANNGLNVVMRYLNDDDETIETFTGTLPKEVLGADTTEGVEVKGSFLPENITSLSLSPNKQKLFYLFETGEARDTAVGTILNFIDGKKTQIFDSPFTEWLSVWPSDKLISLSTKPSGSILGYTYSLNTDTRSFTRTLGGINGLSTLTSPDGKSILYSDSTLALHIYNTSTRAETNLGIRTLPEKCTWNTKGLTIYCAVPQTVASGEYPDSWYQGEASFEDQIWKVNAVTGEETLVADPSSILLGTIIDGTKLNLDDAENYLFFVNKTDSFLWKLDLK